MFQFHTVQLKRSSAKRSVHFILFQFHTVQLKHPVLVGITTLPSFQFHTVQLKPFFNSAYINKSNVSIPYGTIKTRAGLSVTNPPSSFQFHTVQLKPITNIQKGD